MNKIISYGKQNISFKDIYFVVKALKSSYLTQGPKIKEFEQKLCDYTGVKYCLVLSNGTAPLHLAIQTLGIKPGDEVITTPITFVATSNSVLYSGGTVKFVDVEPETANINPENILKAITPNTKGIIVTHFAGQSCDMQKIYDIAKKYNLFVIEDGAHAIGSEYKGYKVGSCKFSDFTTFSFHPVKTITTGEGGAITTNNKDYYEKLLLLRTHGITKNPNNFFDKNNGDWFHEQQELGFNYRLTDFQAALGISQLSRIDKFIKRRREIVDLYKKLFSGDSRFNFLQEKDFNKSAFHLCPLLIDFSKIKINKVELFEKLKKNGLYLQVHYIPVYCQPYYKNLGFKQGLCFNAEEYYEKSISLPIYYCLKDRDIFRIVNIIKNIVF